MTTYIPVIDESACLAHSDCEVLAPDVFHVEDVASVIGTAPSSSSSRSPKHAPPVRSA